MGRRGPKPDFAKREAFARLIAEGVPSARACRMVGINRRTGKRWRSGRAEIWTRRDFYRSRSPREGQVLRRARVG
jgi:DNA invertase Pin-like site-specific DNA recombinase